MKIKSKVILLAATIIVGVAPLQASPTLSQQIDKIPAVEIPAFAVRSVLSAEEDARLTTAINLVRTIAVQNERALVPAVVSIARAVPQVAPIVAAEAAKLSPNQARIIAVRVAQAVPSLAADVAFRVVGASKLSAAKSAEIAELVVRVAPASQDMTLSAVSSIAPATRGLLTSKFPNALIIAVGVQSQSGTILKQQASADLAAKNDILNDETKLQQEATKRGKSVEDTRKELITERNGAQQLVNKANTQESQPPTKKTTSETQAGVDPVRNDPYAQGG